MFTIVSKINETTISTITGQNMGRRGIHHEYAYMFSRPDKKDITGTVIHVRREGLVKLTMIILEAIEQIELFH